MRGLIVAALLLVVSCAGKVDAGSGDASDAYDGTDSHSCSTSADCPSGETCLFEIGAPCPGAGACFQGWNDGFNVCELETYYCGCDGRAVTVSGCPEVGGMNVNKAPVPLTSSEDCPYDGG